MSEQIAAGPGAPGGFQRQTILIKKHIQYRYMALIFFSVLAGFLMVALELVWSFSRVFSQRPVLIEPLFTEMAPMLPVIGIKVLIYLAIVLIVSGVISHRMAGPIFKIEKSLGVIGEGDLSHRVFLRKHDQMTDLRDAVNSMAGRLGAQVSAEREKALELKGTLAKLADQADGAELKKQLLQAADSAGALNSAFKV
ncbi:MAG: methyl-accepting chemotaxis protein [Elusimicrobiaceae bacterium]|nr:methyl-accepting chemotaxis protein [Elusimicrobiaceae bacterium]